MDDATSKKKKKKVLISHSIIYYNITHTGRTQQYCYLLSHLLRVVGDHPLIIKTQTRLFYARTSIKWNKKKNK